MSPFRPSFLPQPDVYFRNQPLLPSSAPRSVNISPILSTLRILPVTTGVSASGISVHAFVASAPSVLAPAPTWSGWQIQLFISICGIPVHAFAASVLSVSLWQIQSALCTILVQCKSLRINTCKSVSKQKTLTSFRINTYEKTGEGRGEQRLTISLARAPSKDGRGIVEGRRGEIPLRAGRRFARAQAEEKVGLLRSE